MLSNIIKYIVLIWFKFIYNKIIILFEKIEIRGEDKKVYDFKR